MRRLLLLAWLPWILFLFPLPPEVGRQVLSESAREGLATQKQNAEVDTPAQTPNASPATQIDPDVVTGELWMAWLQHLGLLLMGLAVGVIAWRRARFWRFFVIAMSLFYLSLVVLRYVQSDRVVPDAWLFFATDSETLKLVQLNLRLVEVGIANNSLLRPARIVLSEILMPIFQMVVLLWAMLNYPREDDGGMVQRSPS